MTDQLSFVYENVEVVKTGRVAYKQLRVEKIDMLVEVTPKHENSGVWKKWVRENDLYTIKDERK